ncbi:carbonic anhydrase [Bacillus sp. T3]|uniref:carbonic anhydrase n=1 Tax=Bacillus sp. T3 TaxID=467262 RepID=UPI00298103E3|nr:carbonic anhydrase [Bacillus sp. T3]
MNLEEQKKVLFVIGMEHNLETIIKQNMNINPESSLFIHRDRPEALEPFGNLMRDIIISVYMENVEEIYLVSTQDEKKKEKSILNKIYEKIESQEEIQTLDYLFKNCMPEFPDSNLIEWLEGSQTLTDVQKRIDVIRNHPLMPSNIKVTELFIHQENKKIILEQ